MRPTEDDIARHMDGFVAMLDAAFVRYGRAEGLPAPLRAAVREVLRHRFVHRFRIDNGALQDVTTDHGGHLATIYSDQVMRHVDTAGAPLRSSNSQPSYVLWLLHLLDVQPGQNVLEIGSGSGWLAAIMARLVGPAGHVTGIEIIADLAAQSRDDLAALAQANVTILTRDGTGGHAAGAPFDRVIITAATWDLPAALFEQVTEGGLVLVPIALRGEAGCQVTLLRRRGASFVSEHALPGWFVPLTGAGQTPDGTADLPSWDEAPSLRCKLPFGAHAGFRAFLGRTEPGFAAFGPDVPSVEMPWNPAFKFGIVDSAVRSAAICAGGELVCHGDLTTGRRLVRAYTRWADLGLIGTTGFDLEIVRRGAAPAPGASVWIEPRGDTSLIWRLKPDTTAWRALLA